MPSDLRRHGRCVTPPARYYGADKSPCDRGFVVPITVYVSFTRNPHLLYPFVAWDAIARLDATPSEGAPGGHPGRYGGAITPSGPARPPLVLLTARHRRRPKKTKKPRSDVYSLHPRRSLRGNRPRHPRERHQDQGVDTPCDRPVSFIKCLTQQDAPSETGRRSATVRLRACASLTPQRSMPGP